ncbi:MAG: hypothetical protein KA313_11520, partial [Pseudarcicella sp.]|nr:hypothetical protein [Pseudarcicella sp.]
MKKINISKSKVIFYFPNLLLLVLASISSANAQSTYSQDLSTNNWKIWQDHKARWTNDKLYLPPVNIQELPINEPTCGWEKLWDGRGKTVNLPANVEEHFWGENGATFGSAGNYKGVAWFITKTMIPENLKGKKITLNIESLRIRGEIFINEKLVGYDLIDSTPLEIDISKFVNFGTENKIEIRVTDGDGNFEWMDLANFNWGDYKIPPSHGFCGITGKIHLRATEKTFIEDIFIKNKPLANSIEVAVNLNNETQTSAEGTLQYILTDFKDPNKVLFETKKTVQNFDKSNLSSLNITLNNAKLWSPETPNLYNLTIIWTGKNNTKHIETKRFGFRWFEVKTVNGDKQFYLNNQRIVLRTSISWGYWPINGIAPSYELAKKQIQVAKDLGLNMLNFHRHMGQTMLLDLADEMGLLYYAEPGGYKTGTASTFTADWNREKMTRMIKRDRSHPSLVIYNMINESTREPAPHEIKDIALFHQLDPSRCITFTSTNFTPKLYNSKLEEKTEKPAKMHMLPYDTTIYYKGWWDMHFAEGPGVYKDELYKNPTNFLRNSTNLSEIIFWG